jgi:phenylacetate-CoA ligase
VNRTDQMILKFREVLKETERLEPDDLWTYQQSRLEPLLLHARKFVPFYRRRLSAVFDGGKIDFSRWNEIPIFTKEDASKNRSRLRAKEVPQALGDVAEKETSGSMGRPLRFFINDLVDVASLSMTDRLYRWWHFDGSKTMASFVPPRTKLPKPEQTITHGWRSGFPVGRNFMRSSAGDMDAHIDWLSEVRPDYLVSYPSMIRALAERCRERNVELRFEKIISRGWMVDQENWRLCRKVFHAQLVDQYGANEIGSVACQCPHCKAYHINAEIILVEVLDKQGLPVAPGETGRVILTSFYNYAMPFIRYEIGDVAQVAPTGPKCEIGLPRLSRIAGRYRNTFLLRDGRVIYPNPPMSRFREFLSYRQIQVVQTDYETLEVRYVPDEANKVVNEGELERWLQEELDPEFKVKLVQVAGIAALPSGKFEEFVSMVRSRQDAR